VLRIAGLVDVTIALDRTPAAEHHLAVGLFAHAGHAAGHLLEGPAVGRTDLSQKIDVAAQRDAAIEVARQHGLLLLLAHRPLVEIGALVGLETLTVCRRHQRHAELVEVIAQA
jgi:hypothetical protein